MLVLVLIVASAAIGGYGWWQQSTPAIGAAMAVALLAALLVPATRWLGPRRVGAPAPDAEDEQSAASHGSAPGSDPGPATPAVAAQVRSAGRSTRPGAGSGGPVEVAFRPGQLVFHDPACSLLVGAAASLAGRDQLEAGGMLPCERCLPPAV
ncbi:hypothetical protein K8Z61_12535 [Nocardioides sp. TRM66260-LWL]|uniref:hypothetical protein n=1 Tax=Nocardioides sp. TRM66260-LWL TaxID=2874478 RepID=UPI001CC734AA|nr:hypothetical protein [Nocardioides sp. TRM66260-LWL]MBZ5735323.1 hypothetical protein [Nocardioides sp. TRM66260-LWL]